MDKSVFVECFNELCLALDDVELEQYSSSYPPDERKKEYCIWVTVGDVFERDIPSFISALKLVNKVVIKHGLSAQVTSREDAPVVYIYHREEE